MKLTHTQHQNSTTSTSLLEYIHKGITWSFYTLFFLLPFIMFPTTFELFEFNKMWFLFAVALIIFFLWASKCILSGKLTITRTPLDIPILLFLASQLLSTIFSIDRHVSFWGYYSRFNGGFLSLLSYVFLYYAFASNVIAGRLEHEKEKSYKILLLSVIAGILVALWGFPSHFGYDPTCYMFRGTLDVSCWTEAFQPRVRIFSTLGQPNWLASFLSILLPIALVLGIKRYASRPSSSSSQKGFFSWEINQTKKADEEEAPEITDFKSLGIWNVVFFVAAVLFYTCIYWTRSQSGFAAFWVGNSVFTLLLAFYLFRAHHKKISAVLKTRFFQLILFVNILFLVINFFLGFPIPRLNQFTYPLLKERFAPKQAQTSKTTNVPTTQAQVPPAPGELGGTDSGIIRNIVWRGAIEIFKKYPVFGSGVETYAYAYYQVRPKEHNVTSEWDYLYNKAHNEFLNYLATTGIVGLGTYLLFIGWFFYLVVIAFRKNHSSKNAPLAAALVGGFVSILISNYYGFSVVIVNLFLFFIPLFFTELMLPKKLIQKTIPQGAPHEVSREIGAGKMIPLIAIALIVLYLEYLLLIFWIADKKYALGYNLDKVNDYVQGSQYLAQATQIRPGQYLFKDEYSVNLATLALFLAQQNETTQAAQLALQAKQLSDEVVAHHPNNVVYLKSRTRVLYSLAQMDKRYLPDALEAIEKAHTLAPTDAKIIYNMALLYDQEGKRDRAIELLKEAVALKPNYRDAYYALALFFAQVQKDNQGINPANAEEARLEAIKYLEYTMKNVIPNDKQAQELLDSLKK